jgi:hypothetical protein
MQPLVTKCYRILGILNRADVPHVPKRAQLVCSCGSHINGTACCSGPLLGNSSSTLTKPDQKNAVDPGSAHATVQHQAQAAPWPSKQLLPALRISTVDISLTTPAPNMQVNYMQPGVQHTSVRAAATAPAVGRSDRLATPSQHTAD